MADLPGPLRLYTGHERVPFRRNPNPGRGQLRALQQALQNTGPSGALS